MSDPTKLERMVELAHKFAGDIMVGTKKELMPMFVIERGEQVDVIGCPFENDQEKQIMVTNVALEIVARRCDAWSFLTESWFVFRNKDESLEPRPSEDPNRREGVVCLASDGLTTIVHGWETKRDSEGNCTELVKYSDGKHFESWISRRLNRAMKVSRGEPI